MKILFASKNKNKFKEIKEIFKDSKFEIIFDDDLEDVVEDKDTILGNAQKKSEEIPRNRNDTIFIKRGKNWREWSRYDQKILRIWSQKNYS